MLITTNNNQIFYSEKSGYKEGEIFDYVAYALRVPYPNYKLARFHNLKIESIGILYSEILTFDFSEWFINKEKSVEIIEATRYLPPSPWIAISKSLRKKMIDIAKNDKIKF